MHFTRALFPRIGGLILAALLPLCAQRAAADDSVLRLKYGDHSLNLTATELAAIPHAEFVATNGHTKETHRYAGVPVRVLLTKLEVPSDEKLRGKLMQLTVLVRAADGYGVAFGITQFDERFTDRTVYLVDNVDGHPLDSKWGPLALIISGDKVPGRWARMVTAIDVQ
jgi:hypothetical protein